MEKLSKFLLRVEPDERKRLTLFRSLVPRLYLVRAYDTTERGLEVCNDGGQEWFDEDSDHPPEQPLRLVVVRHSQGSASDSPYSLMVQVLAHCRNVLRDRSDQIGADSPLSDTYIADEHAEDWVSIGAAGSSDGRPERSRNADSTWPWGAHETELLRKLADAANRFWRLYDPDDYTTAPTNQQVSEWLKTQGVAQRTAEIMATILRADSLPTGPRT